MANRRQHTIWTDSEGNSAEIVLVSSYENDPAIYIADSWEDDYSEDSMP